MPFWCNDTIVFSLIRQTSTVQRFVVSFVLIFFPTVFVLFFFYFPSGSQLKKLKIECNSLSLQKSKLDEIYSQLKVFELENEKKLNILNSRFKNNDPAEIVMNLLQEHKLSCSDIKPIKSKQKYLLRSDCFIVHVKGLFRNSLDFFDALQKNDQNIKICNLKMYKWKDNRIKFDLVFKYVSIKT